jgi:hypothetical protein
MSATGTHYDLVAFQTNTNNKEDVNENNFSDNGMKTIWYVTT